MPSPALAMENHERLVQSHAAAGETLPENVGKNQVIQLHPGAAKWFEENGYDVPDNG
jgi:TRAP-type uncharacterized transport system substrate-binding protein